MPPVVRPYWIEPWASPKNEPRAALGKALVGISLRDSSRRIETTRNSQVVTDMQAGWQARQAGRQAGRETGNQARQGARQGLRLIYHCLTEEERSDEEKIENITNLRVRQMRRFLLFWFVSCLYSLRTAWVG